MYRYCLLYRVSAGTGDDTLTELPFKNTLSGYHALQLWKATDTHHLTNSLEKFFCFYTVLKHYVGFCCTQSTVLFKTV